MSIPPAVVVICKASAPVPVEDKIKLESVAPAKAIVKSSAAPSVVEVILAATPAESIDKPTLSIVTKPWTSTSIIPASTSNIEPGMIGQCWLAFALDQSSPVKSNGLR